MVLEAHPAHDSNGPWWYGTLPDGRAGWFPSSYVSECHGESASSPSNPTPLFMPSPANDPVQPCRALYDYDAGNAEEMSLSEGQNLAVVDTSDPDWWKVERDGAILLVPAAYVEIIG